MKTEVNHLFPNVTNLCDFLFVQGAWWISFRPKAIPVWINQINLTIKLSSFVQPGISQGRIALYMKSDRGEMYSIYLMYFYE